MGYLILGSPYYEKEKDVEIIRIIIYTGIILSGLIIGICTYLVIVGGNINKTEEEKKFEDEEQMKYINELKNGGKNVGKRYL